MLQKPGSVVAVLGLSALAACAPAASPVASGAAAEAEVRRVVDQWVSAFERHDAATVAGLYAPRGVHIVGGTRFEGTSAIQERLAQAARVGSEFSVADREVRVAGDYAFETGVAAQTITPASGQPQRAVADYIAVHARQRDGTWEIQVLAAGPQQPNAPAIQRTIADYFAAIRAGNPSAWLETFATDAVSEDPVGAPPMRGHAALGQFFANIGGAFDEIGLTERDVVISGNQAAVYWTGRGVGKNGREVSFEGVDVFEFNEQGKIQRMWAYWSPGPVMAAVQP